MSRSAPSRKTSTLSQPVHKRLNNYAFAAGAAGVGMLALAMPAEGKVVFTPDNQQIASGSGGSALYLDLNHDGINDFSFFNFFSSTSFILGLSISPVNAGNEIFSTGRGNVFSVFAAALPIQRRVGPQGKFQKQAGLGMANDDDFSSNCQGPWVDATEKYLGLKFLIDGEVHYGWARLNVRCASLHPVHATITGYAYETVANQSIITGDTGSGASDDAVVSGSLGDLALGAAGASKQATPEKQ